MAKAIFRNNEVLKTDQTVRLQLVQMNEPEIEEVEEVDMIPEYEGPTVDDLRREAETYRMQWEEEKKRLKEDAEAEADAIMKNAEEAAFSEVKRQTDQAQTIKADAEEKAEDAIKSAEEKAASIIAEAEAKREEIQKDAYQQGFTQGSADGFKEGSQEVERLVARLHTILERIMGKRQQILNESEQQIVDLVLLMSRKVVKIIAENQRDVVLSNVRESLQKLKEHSDVIIRVNLEDAKLTTAHADEFIKSIENVSGITVVEDTTVDRGGCLIETDFGAIDARIASQLAHLEQKILELCPIQTTRETASESTATSAATAND